MTHAQRIEEYRRAIQAIVDHELHRRAVADASKPGLPMWAVMLMAVVGAFVIVVMVAAYGATREA